MFSQSTGLLLKISRCWVYAFCRIILPTIIWSQVCLSRVWVTLTGQQDSWCMDNSTGNRLVRWSDMLLNCVTVFSVSSSFTPWVEVSILFVAKMWKCSVTCLIQYFIMKMSTYFKYCKINYLIYTPYQKKASCLIDAPLQS